MLYYNITQYGFLQMKDFNIMSDFAVNCDNMCADLIFASGERCANMLYATGLNLPDEFIYLGMAEERLAIVSDLEYDRARVQAPAWITVRNQNEFGSSLNVVELIARLHEVYSVKKFRVPYDFPVGLAVQLQKKGIACEVGGKNFFPQRSIKREDEIACIRQAMLVNEHAMRCGWEALGACSVDNAGQLRYDNELFTCEKLRSIIDSALAANDAVGAGTIAAAGVQSSMPHCRGEGVIRAGEPIVIDIFPRMNASGYFGDLTRTVVKGSAPEIVKRAFEAVRIVRDECKAMLRSGMPGCQPYDHALARLTALGFPTGSNERGFYGFFHGLGHGVGLEIHESPRLSRRVEHKLQSGEVVTVEPGVYYPEWGGIRLEDLVVVRDDACECLTGIETFLEIE